VTAVDLHIVATADDPKISFPPTMGYRASWQLNIKWFEHVLRTPKKYAPGPIIWMESIQS